MSGAPKPGVRPELITQLDAHEQLSKSFKAATAGVRKLRGRETHRAGALSNAQYGLLFGLRERSELPVGELACAAELAPATATEMLDGLFEAGLVRRTRSERDRRQVLVSLTDRGRALVEERRARYEPRWRGALSEFSDRDLRVAASVLDRIYELFVALAAEIEADQAPAEPGRAAEIEADQAPAEPGRAAEIEADQAPAEPVTTR